MNRRPFKVHRQPQRNAKIEGRAQKEGEIVRWLENVELFANFNQGWQNSPQPRYGVRNIEIQQRDPVNGRPRTNFNAPRRGYELFRQPKAEQFVDHQAARLMQPKSMTIWHNDHVTKYDYYSRQQQHGQLSNSFRNPIREHTSSLYYKKELVENRAYGGKQTNREQRYPPQNYNKGGFQQQSCVKGGFQQQPCDKGGFQQQHCGNGGFQQQHCDKGEFQQQLRVGPNYKWSPSSQPLGQYSIREPNKRHGEDEAYEYNDTQTDLYQRLCTSQNNGPRYNWPPRPLGELSLREPNRRPEEDGAHGGKQREQYQNYDNAKFQQQLLSGPKFKVPLIPNLPLKKTNFIREINKDLFSCDNDSAMAVCVGEDFYMNPGIYREFQERFGKIEELMMRRKQAGQVAFIKADGAHVYYLITKALNDTSSSLTCVKKCLIELKALMIKHGEKKLAITNMHGVGGNDSLRWGLILKKIRTTFMDSNIEVEIYVKPKKP